MRGTRARRAIAGEPGPRALLALVRRNRRRYGGYIVHVGMAVLFVGRRGLLVLPALRRAGPLARASPPTSAPTRSATSSRPPRLPPPTTPPTPALSAWGPASDVLKGSKRVATLEPSEGYYPSGEPPGHRRKPDRRPAGEPHRDERRHHPRRLERGGSRTSKSPPGRDRQRRRPDAAPRRRASWRSASRPRLPAPPAPGHFHFIVSPLVMWIWLGGLIVLGGGESPSGRPRTRSAAGGGPWRAPRAACARLPAGRRPPGW